MKILFLKEFLQIFLLLPTLCLSLLALFCRSQIPLFLGRYSLSFLVLNMLNAVGLGWAYWSLNRKRALLFGISAVFLFLIIYGFSGNLEFYSSPLSHLLVLVSHASLGMLCFSAAFGWVAHSSNLPGRSRWLISLGTVLCVLTVADAIGVPWLEARERAHFPRSFRVPVDTDRIEPDAWIVLGDSVAWGLGVKAEEAFPAVLGRLLFSRGLPSKVYNLGIIDTGPNEYLGILKRVPRHRRSIVCFYMNDMPQKETSGALLPLFFRSLRDGGFVPHLILSRLSPPTMEEYLRQQVLSYQEDNPTFPARWKLLTEQLDRLASEAKSKTEEPPLLIVFPLLYDFSDYPLGAAHPRLAEAARRAGFEVLDLLPEFSLRFSNGKRFWAAANDNHPNAEVHRRVAELLADFLSAENR